MTEDYLEKGDSSWVEIREDLEELHSELVAEDDDNPEALYELERALDSYQNSMRAYHLEKDEYGD